MVLDGDAREDPGRRLGRRVRLAWAVGLGRGTARDSTMGRGEDRGMSVLNSYMVEERTAERNSTQRGVMERARTQLMPKGDFVTLSWRDNSGNSVVDASK